MRFLVACAITCAADAQIFETASLDVREQRRSATNIETSPANLTMSDDGVGAVTMWEYQWAENVSQEVSGYARVQIKTGHKLEESSATDAAMMSAMRGTKAGLSGCSLTTGEAASVGSEAVGTPVHGEAKPVEN